MDDGAAPAGKVAAPIAGVLFDIDDTLVDTATAFRAALVGSIGAVVPLDPAQEESVINNWRDDVGGYYRAYIAGEYSFTEQRRHRLLAITDLLGVPALSDGQFAAWDVDYEERFAASWALFDDARASVEAAVAAGLAVGVVTNAPGALQRNKLAAVGLADLLTELVAVDEFGVGKPAAPIFHEGCRLLGTAPGATLYIGDELEYDARGAVAAGLGGVWLDRPGRRRGGPKAVTEEHVAAARAQGVAIITSLTGLPRLWANGPA